MAVPAIALSSKEGSAGWDHTLASVYNGDCIDGMPVTGRPGIAMVQVSEFLLRVTFPYVFSGPLPVTGVILADASQSDLDMVTKLPTNWGRLSFSDTALLESSTEVLQAMGVSRAALDIEMPTYTSSQDTLSQDSRASLPFEPSGDEEPVVVSRLRRRRATPKRMEPEQSLVVEKARWCRLCNRNVKGGNLSRHMFEIHKEGEAPEFLCRYCGKGFSRRETLEKRHRCKMNPATHPFSCPVCSRGFKTEKQLFNHGKNGTCSKATCEKCGEVFLEQRLPQHQARCVAPAPTPEAPEMDHVGGAGEEADGEDLGGGGVAGLVDIAGLTLEEALAASLNPGEYEIVCEVKE